VLDLPDADDPEWYPNEEARVLGTAENLNWNAQAKEQDYQTMTLESFERAAQGFL